MTNPTEILNAIQKVNDATAPATRAAEKFEDYVERVGLYDAVDYMSEEMKTEGTYNDALNRLHEYTQYALDERAGRGQWEAPVKVKNTVATMAVTEYKNLVTDLMNRDFAPGEQRGTAKALQVVDRILRLLGRDVPSLR